LEDEAEEENERNERKTNKHEAFSIPVDRASDTLINKHRARIMKYIFRKLKAAGLCSHCQA